MEISLVCRLAIRNAQALIQALVSIRPDGRLDYKKDNKVFIINGIAETDVKADWLDSQHLLITYKSGEEIYLQEKQWKDVQISYKEVK